MGVRVSDGTNNAHCNDAIGTNNGGWRGGPFQGSGDIAVIAQSSGDLANRDVNIWTTADPTTASNWTEGAATQDLAPSGASAAINALWAEQDGTSDNVDCFSYSADDTSYNHQTALIDSTPSWAADNATVKAVSTRTPTFPVIAGGRTDTNGDPVCAFQDSDFKDMGTLYAKVAWAEKSSGSWSVTTIDGSSTTVYSFNGGIGRLNNGDWMFALDGVPTTITDNATPTLDTSYTGFGGSGAGGSLTVGRGMAFNESSTDKILFPALESSTDLYEEVYHDGTAAVQDSVDTTQSWLAPNNKGHATGIVDGTTRHIFYVQSAASQPVEYITKNGSWSSATTIESGNYGEPHDAGLYTRSGTKVGVINDNATDGQIWLSEVDLGGGATTQTATASVDAALQNTPSLAPSLDAAIQIERQSFASLDSTVAAQILATVSLDAAISAAQQAASNLDAAMTSEQSTTAALDAAVQAAVALSASLDALIAMPARTATASIDAAIQAATTVVASIDAAIQAGRIDTVNLDVAISVERTLAASMDIAVAAVSAVTPQIDAAVAINQLATAVMDASVTAAAAGGGIERLATVTNAVTSVSNDTPLSASHTVDAGTTILVVNARMQEQGSGAVGHVTSVKYGGVDLTQAIDHADGEVFGGSGSPIPEECRSSLWYLVNPTEGSATLEANNDGGTGDSSSASWTAVNYSGVSTIDPVGATEIAGGVSASPHSLSITTTVDNSMIVGGDTASSHLSDPFTPDTGVDEIADGDSGGTTSIADHGYWMGERLTTSAGSYGFGCTPTGSRDYALVAMELLPAQPAAITSLDAALVALRSIAGSIDAAVAAEQIAVADLGAAISADVMAAISIDAVVEALTGEAVTASLDAVISGLTSRSALIDAAISVRRSTPSSLDAAIAVERFSTAALGAAVSAETTALTSIDTAIQSALFASAQLDSAILAGRITTTDIDAAVQVAKAVALSLDAFVSVPGLAFEITSIDAVLRAVASLSASLDSAIQGIAETSASIDAAIAIAEMTSASLDLAVAATNSATAVLDAGLLASVARSADIDAAITASRSLSTSMDALLSTLSATISTTSLDAAVKGAVSSGLSIDALIASQALASASIDAAIAASASSAMSIDAILLQSNTSTVGLDFAASALREISASLDAAMAHRATLGVSLDALLAFAGITSADIDAAILSTISMAVSLDAFVSLPGQALRPSSKRTFMAYGGRRFEAKGGRTFKVPNPGRRLN